MSSLHVPYAAASAALVRHRMQAELGESFPEEALDAAVLVVSELVGNAVRHGTALPGGGLVASWDLLGTGLRVQVVDGGEGLPGPLRAPGHSAPDAEGGRGLELVDALATTWGSTTAATGTAVWAELPAAVHPG